MRGQRRNNFLAGAIVLAGALGMAGCQSATGVSSGDATASSAATSEAHTAGAATGEGDADYPELTLRYSSPLPESMSVSQGVEWWAEQVESRSGGAITVERFHGGSLLGAVDTLAGLQDGRVELGYLTAGYWPSEFPLWNAVGVPFLTSESLTDAAAWSHLSRESAPLSEEFTLAGVRPLFFMPLSQTVFGTRDELEGSSDLTGKRVRAIGYLATALQEAGVEPIAMDPSELYEAIQRGVLDGFAGWPFDVTASSGLHEVAPHFVMPGVGHYTSSALGISESVWSDLPPKVQELFEAVAEDYANWVPDALAEAEAAACQALADVGGTITVWTDAEAAEFESVVGDAAIESWMADAVATGLDESTVTAFLDDYLSTYEALASGEQGGAELCADA